MKNNTVAPIFDHVTFSGSADDSVSFAYAEKVEQSTKQEQAKRKTTRDKMLTSIPLVTHPDVYHELAKMVHDEYKVGMMEISSGNGTARNMVDENGEYIYMLSANTSEQSEQARIGLEAGLVDAGETLANKNISTIPAYEVVTDDNGEQLRIDDMANMITVNDSDYSIWDTIAEQGLLIVRHQGHWKLSGCRFDKDNYKAREARRMKAKHKRLLGITTAQSGSNTNPKAIKVKQLNVDKKGNKQLTRLARDARRGKQYAIDELAKIGYNEFS